MDIPESIRQTGGIVPDDCWEQNRRIVKEAVAVTAELGVEYLSFHAGFIDHEDSDGFLRFGRRMSELADAAAERGVMLLMETGQETDEELRAFLDILHSSPTASEWCSEPTSPERLLTF